MSNEQRANDWFRCLAPRPMAGIRLFCIPHAGGSASAFQSWSATLPPEFELFAAQLPGRENRFFEPPYTEIDPLIEALQDALVPLLSKPFVIFGHSMGALIGFELARRLRRSSLPAPLRLYVAAHRAPHLPDTSPRLHTLSDADLIVELDRLGGIPEEVQNDQALRRLLLPPVRADMAVCETYTYSPDAPLDVPIVAFGGVDDFEVTPDQLAPWSEQTSAAFRMNLFPGDHFFTRDTRRPFLQTLNSDLRCVAEQAVENESPDQRIAIIGMSCRLPGADTPDEFWQNLCAGTESISHFTPEDLQKAGLDPAIAQYPNYVNARGVINQVDQFDADFFGYSPREAQILDPQQRIFLECAWEALENAGYDPLTYDGLIGVYAGMGMSRYLFTLLSNAEIMSVMGNYQVMLANDKDYISTRTAYKLNLRGPALTVQTACSTSLVAAAMACRSLLDYTCDMVIIGGSTIEVPQSVGYFYQEGAISSPDGHCRAFDAEASGTVGGNGSGAVILKRLSDARADGDTIHAVILGSAINNDGSIKVGFTAPSVGGQAAAIAMAQAVADVGPETIGYIETHGTGTPLGDPIEIEALRQVFGTDNQQDKSCALGAVKTNIGHLDTAAGVASLIKTALILKHKMLPPTLHFRTPNPQIDFARSPFYVNTELKAWPAESTPRRAGVSAFGIGGTNCHLILEEAIEPESVPSLREFHILTMSARSVAALDAMSFRLADQLRSQGTALLDDIGYTLHVGRRVFEHRRTLVCRDIDDAITQLTNPNSLATVSDTQPRAAAFMFPGQGAQFLNMALGVYETEPVFRGVIDECAELLRAPLSIDLRSVLFSTTRHQEDADDMLRQTWLTQPALFVIEYALARQWMHWGLQPSAMIGHSIGEYVAACLANVFSLADALNVVAERGRLMQAMPEGMMVAVALVEHDLLPMLNADLSIAAVNAPGECVVSGTEAGITRLELNLKQRDITFRRLRTNRAFHSVLTESILAEFRAFLQTVTFNPPSIPFISNVSGQWITDVQATDPEYWTQHVRETVRYADGVRLLLEDGGWLLLEVGPGRTLIGLAKQNPACSADQIMIASLRQYQDMQSDSEALAKALGEVWLTGSPIDWRAYHHGEMRRRVPMPTYPFQRERYWVDPLPATHAGAAPSGSINDWLYVPRWRESPLLVTAMPAESSSRWLVFADATGCGDKLAERLHALKHYVVKVQIGTRFERIDEFTYRLRPGDPAQYIQLITDLQRANRLPTHVMHLWSISSSITDDLTELKDRSFYSLLFLAQAMGSLSTSADCQITTVSNHLYRVKEQDFVQPIKALIAGPCKVIPQEFPALRCRSVDIHLAGAGVLPALIDQLLQEAINPSSDAVVALRGDVRWTQTYERSPVLPTSAPRLRQNGVYLITGGLGGIGLAIAEYLARVVQARVVLVGRSSVPERSAWDQWMATHDPSDETHQRIERLQTIENHGGTVRTIKADVTDATQMLTVLSQIYAEYGVLHGVLHTAGVAGGGIIQLKTREEVERVFAPKVTGTLLLTELLRETPLDFMVLFSSLASIFGGPGQVDYCAANAFLDAAAHAAVSHIRFPIISINWDRWQEVGMAVKTEAPADLRGHQGSGALRGLRIVEGLQAFERIMTSTQPQFLVSTFDVGAAFNSVGNSNAQHARPEHHASRLKMHERPKLAAAYMAPETADETTITDIFETLLGIHPVGSNDSFFELGGHSLLAIQLASRLRQIFGIEVPVQVIFDYPRVKQLAVNIETLRWALEPEGNHAAITEQEFEEGEV